MKIRSYRAQDRTACREIFQRAVHEGAASHYDHAQRQAWAPLDAPFDRESPDPLLAQSCWVAEEAGHLTGFMSLTRQGHIEMAFVLPRCRGGGVAAALYDRLLERARPATLTSHASHLFRLFLLRRGWQVDHAETIHRGGVALERFHMTLHRPT